MLRRELPRGVPKPQGKRAALVPSAGRLNKQQNKQK
jgi:hypothetical protein